MKEYFKAVRLVDRTSHWDKATKWRKGAIVKPDRVEAARRDGDVCGHGIHCSPTLLDAVSWQYGPSLYCVVEPINIIIEDESKARCDAVRVIRWLSKWEQDGMAGFKLYEANRSVNPLLRKPRRLTDATKKQLIKEWIAVYGAVSEAVYRTVDRAVYRAVDRAVDRAFYRAVDGAHGGAVNRTVDRAVEAYIGGLFPDITKWKYIDGPDPWRPLLRLWYAGYVPTFDGETWRLHCGPKADVCFEMKGE